MARYMIPPKAFSLTTLPGAFIIVFALLGLPFFLAHELGATWVEGNLALILACTAVPSLAAALWIARWVEKKQAEEWLELDDEGVTSTMRTRPHPKAKSPAERQQASLAAGAARQSRRVSWEQVRAVELRSRRSASTPGTHYQVCLITEDDVLPVPLNDDVLGTRHMVEVDSAGYPLSRDPGGKYPGMPIVREIARRVGEVPWRVREVFVGKYEVKEKELAFTGIEDPWSGATISASGSDRARRRRMLAVAAILAILIPAIAFGAFVYYRSRARALREKAEALRKRKAAAEAREKTKGPSTSSGQAGERDKQAPDSVNGER